MLCPPDDVPGAARRARRPGSAGDRGDLLTRAALDRWSWSGKGRGRPLASSSVPRRFRRAGVAGFLGRPAAAPGAGRRPAPPPTLRTN